MLMSSAHLPGGVTVKTFPPAPVGFDPLRAEPAALAHYGIPPRPVGNPRLLAKWEDAIRGTTRRIEPTFRVVKPDGIGAPSATDFVPVIPGGTGSVTGVDLPIAQGPVTFVNGELTVPTGVIESADVQQCLFAVALDRFTPWPLIIAVLCEQTSPNELSFYPVWGMGYQQRLYLLLDNNGDAIGLQPGNVVQLAISVDQSSSTPVTFYFSGPAGAVSFAASLPQGIIFTGQDASWTVEQMWSFNGIPTELPKFGSITFSECAAVTLVGGSPWLEVQPTSTNTTVYAAPGTTAIVIDANNDVVCTD
jgi:Peptidase A4 family